VGAVGAAGFVWPGGFAPATMTLPAHFSGGGGGAGEVGRAGTG